ncbi:HAD family hydrolase [Bradyrhizobium japonicum]|uniref:HAD family hydrolase n=1 Tax=Bradyrhizobium japonicum TaxID=375 RepID=UPI001BA64E49|nr:beta-phosphoglucomutase family hydrolase [Bradyrhizobium japonicum]MBR0764882.1 beta-phosphoglucomutase family hydrolase [Bradyrhizobium japonicum]
MVIIDVKHFDALIFDLDGVITQTATIHSRAWKQLFDEFLIRQATETDGPYVPFDLDTDYRRYVDGKPRIAGVESFLAARGIIVPTGAPGDQADQDTAHGLASRKDRYFAELLTHEGVHVFASAEPLLQQARRHGMRTAIASSSHHCAEILHAAGLTALFDARVDGIDLDRLGLAGKPAPDMFLEAARRLNAAPARTAVFEDATAGVEAARAGDFGLVIGVGPAARELDLLKHGADKVVANLREVRLKSAMR